MRHVELTEMPRNRLNAWCCGAGAGVKSAFKDWSVEIAEQRSKKLWICKKMEKVQLNILLLLARFATET